MRFRKEGGGLSSRETHQALSRFSISTTSSDKSNILAPDRIRNLLESTVAAYCAYHSAHISVACVWHVWCVCVCVAYVVCAWCGMCSMCGVCITR